VKELMEKISTYNIFNYLFPGAIFVVILNGVVGINLYQDNLVLGFFVYYFIGLIISRVGSLIVEPLLKKTGFVVFADYDDYVEASKKDEKIDLYSEINNMYRTVMSLIALIMFAMMYKAWADNLSLGSWSLGTWLSLMLLLVIFLFSYKKQTLYVVKRVNSYKKGVKNG